MLNRIIHVAFWFAYRLAKCYWFIARPNSEGACVAVWFGSKILVIRNSYRSEYGLPAGGLKPNETHVQAAVRELREEVGIQTTPDDLRPFGEFVSRQEFKRDHCIFYELLLDELPEIQIDHREVVSAEFMQFDEFRKLPTMHIVQQYLQQRK